MAYSGKTKNKTLLVLIIVAVVIAAGWLIRFAVCKIVTARTFSKTADYLLDRDYNPALELLDSSYDFILDKDFSMYYRYKLYARALRFEHDGEIEKAREEIYLYKSKDYPEKLRVAFAEDLNRILSEYDEAYTVKSKELSSKLPHKGMREDYIDCTILGKHSDREYLRNYKGSFRSYYGVTRYDYNGPHETVWYSVYVYNSEVIETKDLGYEKAHNQVQSSSTSSYGSNLSPKNHNYYASSYDDPEDFYFDNYEDFESFDDAESYWERYK